METAVWGLLSLKPASLHALNGECASDVPGSETMVGSRSRTVGETNLLVARLLRASVFGLVRHVHV